MKIKWIQLQLTERCNLKCSMCYERNSLAYEKEKYVLDFSRLREIISECASFRPHYELFGGEPLLYPQLDQLLDYIDQNGSKVTIPTNGTLLQQKANALVGNAVEKVWVSLDGPKNISNKQRGENSYQSALKGIIALYEKRRSEGREYPRIGVHCVVTPLNYKNIKDLVCDAALFPYVDNFSFELQKFLTPDLYDHYLDYLKTMDASMQEARFAKGYVQDVATFSRIDPLELSTSLEDIKKMCVEDGKGFYTNPGQLDVRNIHAYFTASWKTMTNHHKSCVFPFAYAEITARGDVTSCHSFYDNALGNIYSQSFTDIWNGPKAAAFRKSIRRQLLPICYACCSYFNPENMA